MPTFRKNERSRAVLQDAGLRPTRQRLAMADLLFDGCAKHVTAEFLHAALRRSRTRVSLATVYNALHQFTTAGLLHEITVDPRRIYFDTHVEPHHHFFDEDSGELHDIAAHKVQLVRVPKLPRGCKLNRVDIVIRVCSSGTSRVDKI